MTNFARIINNIAVDVSHDPENHFHPSIAAQFQPVPDEVTSGWVLDGGKWSAPEAAPTPALEPLAVPSPEAAVSPVEFMLLFTSPERVAIKAARQSDPVIDDFFDIAEDPRLTSIRLAAKSTQDAVMYFALKGLIASARVPVILSGTSPEDAS